MRIVCTLPVTRRPGLREGIGRDPEGTVTFVEPSGEARTCESFARAYPLPAHTEKEDLTSSLYARLDGFALNRFDQAKAEEILRAAGTDWPSLREKIEAAIGIECAAPAI